MTTPETRKPRSHRELDVWVLSMDLTEAVYRVTKGFPKDELYRLVSQLTRAAVSVPANIAEGNGRATANDYANFVSIARGSALEVETLLMIAVRLGYMTQGEVQPLLDSCDRVSRMLYGLHNRLKTPAD